MLSTKGNDIEKRDIVPSRFQTIGPSGNFRNAADKTKTIRFQEQDSTEDFFSFVKKANQDRVKVGLQTYRGGEGGKMMQTMMSTKHSQRAMERELEKQEQYKCKGSYQ